MAIRPSSAKVAPHHHHTGWVAVEDNINAVAEATTVAQTANRRRRSKRKLLQMLLATVCLGSVVAGSTGCTITKGVCNSLDQSECIDEFMIGYRNRALAEKAWHCRVGKQHGRMHNKEFKDGFIDGYMDVASGGAGCIPTIAPSKYWGWKYQSANGQQAVNSYFQGYPLGVKAAEQDGVGHWQSLQVYSPPAAVVPTYAEGKGVENPFYSEEEILMDGDSMPLPRPGEELMDIEENIEMLSPPKPEVLPSDADSTINLSGDDVPELIARLPESSADAGEGYRVQLNSPALQPPVVDAPASTDAGMLELVPADGSEPSEALPFSFE